MLTILPVANTAHLPTKPDSPTKLQKLEDGEQTKIKHQVFNFAKTEEVKTSLLA